MELVFTEDNEYARDTHPQQDALEQALGRLYGVGDNARVAPSGLAAIAAVLHSFVQRQPDGLIWTLDELYDETWALLGTLPHRAAADFSELARATDAPALLLVEACSNPHGRIPDFDRIAQLRRDCPHDFYLVVDNTWLSSAVCNPLEAMGADLVVASLTKYYSGGGAIAGALLSASSGLFIAAADWLSLNGQHVSPYNCQRILERLPSLEQRVGASSARTTALLALLAERNVPVQHPLLAQPTLAARYFRRVDGHLRVPSVLLLERGAPRHSAIAERTSYGGKEDRIERYGAAARLALGYDAQLGVEALAALLDPESN